MRFGKMPSIVEQFASRDYDFLKNLVYSTTIDQKTIEILLSISKGRGLRELEILLMQKMFN